MENRELDDLIDNLGGIIPAVGDVFEPLSKKEVKEIESKFDYELPSVLPLCSPASEHFDLTSTCITHRRNHSQNRTRKQSRNSRSLFWEAQQSLS